MFSKIVYYWPILIFVVILFMWFGLSKRRDLPAQEVVPLDGGIAVINAGKWCNDKLQVSLLSKDDPIQKKHYNDAGECTFRGLSNEKQYTIEIKRTDLKGMLLYKKTKAEVMPKKGGSKYIVLVGASVGKSWEFPKLGERIEIEDHIVLGNRTVYEFDKSTAINALIQLSIPVSGVIVKECSAYFPRDIDQSKEQIETWVSQIQSGNIIPILATVVPVTRENDANHPGKYNSIIQYNKWIRSFTKKRKVMLLDLEEALRISAEDRHLKNEYAQPDGSHLVKKAYDEALDKIAMDLIKAITKKPNNGIKRMLL